MKRDIKGKSLITRAACILQQFSMPAVVSCICTMAADKLCTQWNILRIENAPHYGCVSHVM